MNTIGIDHNLDRARIKKLLAIGLFASTITGIGDFLLGYAEEIRGTSMAANDNHTVQGILEGANALSKKGTVVQHTGRGDPRTGFICDLRLRSTLMPLKENYGGKVSAMRPQSKGSAGVPQRRCYVFTGVQIIDKINMLHTVTIGSAELAVVTLGEQFNEHLLQHGACSVEMSTGLVAGNPCSIVLDGVYEGLYWFRFLC